MKGTTLVMLLSWSCTLSIAPVVSASGHPSCDSSRVERLPDRELRELKEHLLGGGHTILMRHADDCRSEGCTSCNKCINLSKVGRDQTSWVHAAVEHMDLEVGAVYTSPYCRAMETALRAFEKGKVEPSLGLDQAKRHDFLELLEDRHASFSTTVVVTHSENVRELEKAGFSLGLMRKMKGTVAILGRKAEKLEVLGCLVPEDWEKLSQLD